jgi:predicted TIM-barrel fold metal-dependent hydrolase
MGVFVFGGVFERHPRLKMVVAEGDAGWVPHYMYRADHAAERLGTGLERLISKKPALTSRTISGSPSRTTPPPTRPKSWWATRHWRTAAT